MTEDEEYTEVDFPSIVDDSEQLFTEQQLIPENSESVFSAQDSEIANSEDPVASEKKQTNTAAKNEVVKYTRLPMARTKCIMKMDPDVNVISGDAVFLVTKATEMFLETIAKETYAYTLLNKRKTISKRDLDLIINKVDCLCFLEGAMDF